MISMVRKIIKRLSITLFVLFLCAIVSIFYFTQSQSSLEKQSINFKKTLELNKYINEIKQRPHLKGQSYEIVLSQEQLNTAFSFFQALQYPKSNSQITLIDNTIEIQVDHFLDLKLTQRYLPAFSQIELNNYSKPVKSIQINNNTLPQFIQNLANNKIQNIIIEQQLSQLLTTENINIKVQDNNLVISYIWNDLLSEKFIQPELEIEKKVEAAYQALQENLKAKGERKVSLQDAMIELVGYFNDLQNPDERIVFWSVLFASVDSKRANEYLNLNLGTPLVKLTLKNRYDLAKHFVFSAYLQQIGGNVFSNLIGEYKENKDAKTRLTKFSYSDVMANQSGIYFSQVLNSKIDSGQLKGFIEKIKNNELTLDDKLFEDGIDAPTKEKQDQQVSFINEELKKLPIYQ